jgi:hypothetical protein
MSGDVQHTLNELERRLRELQAELAAPDVAPRVEEPPPPEPPPPAEPPAPPPAPRGPLQDQLDELLRFRDQLATAANQLVEDYTRLLEQLERAAQMPAAGGWASSPAAGHMTFPVPPPSSPSSESTLFAGTVVVEAAPFDEIGTLAIFEAVLRSIPQAEDVHVRSFEGGRAVLDVRLAGEVPLVFELRRASDHAFDVEHAEPGRLELAMHPPGDLPFPMRP